MIINGENVFYDLIGREVSTKNYLTWLVKTDEYIFVFTILVRIRFGQVVLRISSCFWDEYYLGLWKKLLISSYFFGNSTTIYCYLLLLLLSSLLLIFRKFFWDKNNNLSYLILNVHKEFSFCFWICNLLHGKHCLFHYIKDWSFDKVWKCIFFCFVLPMRYMIDNWKEVWSIL